MNDIEFLLVLEHIVFSASTVTYFKSFETINSISESLEKLLYCACNLHFSCTFVIIAKLL